MGISKRVKAFTTGDDPLKDYGLEEALGLLKENAKVKFDETLDVSIRLGIDPKKSDQVVRGSVPMPNGLGKKVKVLVFAKDKKAEEAKAAGADYVGSDDLVEKIQGGWLDFDVAVATPDLMRIIARLGKILGTRGMMPNPKTGTVTQNVAAAGKEIKAGKAVFKADKAGIIHAPIGKVSFEVPALVENFKALAEALRRAKPVTVKGVYFQKAHITTTMGPGLRLNPSVLEAA